MNKKEVIKKILKETFYNYSFSTDPKDIDEQELQQEFIKLIAINNKRLKEKHIDKIRFRRKKDSKDFFIFRDGKTEEVKYDDLKKYEEEVINDLSKKTDMTEKEIKKFLDSNEKDALEYLMVAKWLLDNNKKEDKENKEEK